MYPIGERLALLEHLRKGLESIMAATSDVRVADPDCGCDVELVPGAHWPFETDEDDSYPWVQRCDDCSVFPDDYSAAEAVAKRLWELTGERYVAIVDCETGWPYVRRDDGGSMTFAEAEAVASRYRALSQLWPAEDRPRRKFRLDGEG